MKNIDLTKVPTRSLWKELERRASKEYMRRIRSEYRARKAERQAKGE